MHVKRFVGKTMQEALQKMRAEFGHSRDVILLKVREEPRSGLRKLFGGGRAEIIAGVGFRVLDSAREAAASGRSGATTRRAAAAAEAYGVRPPSAGLAPKAGAARPSGAAPSAADEPSVARELRDMKQLLAEVQKHVLAQRAEGLPRELFEEYLGLTTSRVSEALARQVVRRIQDRLPPEARRDARVIREALRATLEQMIPTGGPIRLERGRCRRVAFIGPTGVGKTTTIAKLAGAYAVFQHKRVALVTNDGYRLAASDQLRKIAEIIQHRVDVPFRLVNDGRGACAALSELEDRDVVLIDTAGRGQRDARKMDELQAFLEAVQPDETHLVVSMTTHPDTLIDVVERFSRYRVDYLVVTKLDEAAKFGLLLDILDKVGKSLSYVTTGQGIPNDIQPADARWLAERVLCGCSEAATPVT